MSVKYKIETSWRDSFKTKPFQPVISSLGAATGLGTGQFLGELTSRALGWTKYKKAAAQTAVKGLVGAIFLGACPLDGGIFTIPAAITSWGSIILDWIAAQWPGGVVGWAERIAVKLRKLVVQSRAVSKEIQKIEQAAIDVEPETPPARVVERQRMDEGYGRARNSIGMGRRF